MWVQVDDNFPEHRKVFDAGRHLGTNASGRVVAVWLEGLCYANRNLTDGYLPKGIVAKFKHDRRPLNVAYVMALPDVQLWEEVSGGWRIHDYHHYNPTASDVKAKRQADRERKRKGNPSGILKGVLTESTRIPEHSRGRDPNPNPNPVQTFVTHTPDESGIHHRTEIHPKSTAAKIAAGFRPVEKT